MNERNFSRRNFLKMSSMGISGLLTWENRVMALGNHSLEQNFEESSSLPMPQWNKLPCWRGFNLVEKLIKRDPYLNQAFREEDFQWIHELGFNFVRLPMDYRTWIVDGDWRKFDEKTLTEIDHAVEYGMKHNVHVCLNFHRAPGYTVASPPEEKSVWQDAEALDVCAMHWNTFAKRYQGVSNRNVSFNLFNEPANVEMSAFMRVHRTLCDAIRSEDSQRLIICDSLNWGLEPVMDLLDLNVAQATRGYMPMEISHFRATWAGETFSQMTSPPTWPLFHANGLLLSKTKKGVSKELQKPLRLELSPRCGKTKLVFRVSIVSSSCHLKVIGIDKSGNDVVLLLDKTFVSGPGEGEWTKVIYREEWDCYQNHFGTDYEVDIPNNVSAVEFRAEDGDWISFESFTLQSENAYEKTIVSASAVWSTPPMSIRYDLDDKGVGNITGVECYDKQWHHDQYVLPWKQWTTRGGGVMVGEFGAYKYTPHHVVLSWMEDLLSNWKNVGWGWALWNFRGEIGVIDSNRSDAVYEDFHGHQLDIKMLELLQKYL